MLALCKHSFKVHTVCKWSMSRAHLLSQSFRKYILRRVILPRVCCKALAARIQQLISGIQSKVAESNTELVVTECIGSVVLSLVLGGGFGVFTTVLIQILCSVTSNLGLLLARFSPIKDILLINCINYKVWTLGMAPVIKSKFAQNIVYSKLASGCC